MLYEVVTKIEIAISIYPHISNIIIPSTRYHHH